MRIVLCQGSPVVTNCVLDKAFNEAEFALAINIGFHYSPGLRTSVIVKKAGRIVEREEVFVKTIPASGIGRFLLLPRVYLQYARVILQAVRRWPEAREACFIGRGPNWSAIALLCRRKGLVKRVVYWATDYFPANGSFDTRVIDRTFQAIEKAVIRCSDEVWYVTRRMYDVHANSKGRRLTRAPESVVPWVFDPRPEVHNLWQPASIRHFIYAGYIKGGQGLEIILPAIADVRRRYPDTTLDVCGQGPKMQFFQELAAKLGVADCVRFHGYIEDEAELHRIVARCAAGFILYDPADVGHSYYTMTSKVYEYVGCGTPVIITENAGSFDFVMNAGAGVRVDYTKESVITGMHEITDDIGIHEKYRDSARVLSGRFWEDGKRLRESIERVCG